MNYSQVTVDILQNPRYAGAIDTVRWLTDWIDSGFGMVITIVAFLIILVAMFKNVLAAAYCAYPKFWDRVDAAHKEVESVGWIQQFKDTFMTRDINSGSFSNAIMRILPNIKTLTDFEGDTVRPKTYFIRAIPQMLICIIIGAFIYNGYYRDTAAKVVDFGSEMVSRVLLEVDPIAVFDQFTGAAGRPVFASDGSELDDQKLINKLSVNVYNAVIGEYNDIKGADAKRALADKIEIKMSEWVATLGSQYMDSEAWKSIMQVAITTGEVDISKIDGNRNTDGTVVQHAMQFPVADLNLSSNIHVNDPMYVRVRLNFEKQAVQSGIVSLSDVVLHVPGTTKAEGFKSTYNLTIQGTKDPVGFKLNGADAGTVEFDVPSGTLTITWSGGHGSQETLELLEPLTLRDKKTGKTHKIASIRTGAGSIGISSVQGGITTPVALSHEGLGVQVKEDTGTTSKSEKDATKSDVE